MSDEFNRAFVRLSEITEDNGQAADCLGKIHETITTLRAERDQARKDVETVRQGLLEQRERRQEVEKERDQLKQQLIERTEPAARTAPTDSPPA